MNKYLLALCFAVSCAMADAQSSQENEYTIKLLVGSQMQEMLPFLADWRLTLFREYPYLYDGSLEEENAFCQDFMTYTNAAIAVVYLNDKPVALLTGSSLVAFSSIFGEPDGFKAANYDLQRLYYFAEVLVLPEHRGHGLATRLFKELETWAISRGYTNGCFISEAHDTHPLKPVDYKEHDSLWHALGYEKTDITSQIDWNTVQPYGSSQQQNHVLPYWAKQFTS